MLKKRKKRRYKWLSREITRPFNRCSFVSKFLLKVAFISFFFFSYATYRRSSIKKKRRERESDTDRGSWFMIVGRNERQSSAERTLLRRRPDICNQYFYTCVLWPIKVKRNKTNLQEEKPSSSFFFAISLLSRCIHLVSSFFTFSNYFDLASNLLLIIDRRSQRAKLRSVLHYFQRLSERPPEGHVTFARQVRKT